MPYRNNSKFTSNWLNVDASSLLSTAAQIMMPGSVTDSGRLFPQLDTTHPDPIVLNGGIPDETVFPVDYLAEVFSKNSVLWKTPLESKTWCLSRCRTQRL